jgi:hypothetical protein
MYLPKRIHFKSKLHYEMRVGLTVLDWNEHVDREASSHNNRLSAEHHRRQGGQRVLRPKEYRLVQDIWIHTVD